MAITRDFNSGSYYHVYNRTVVGTKLFRSFADHQRFYENLYVFNNANYRHRGGDPRRAYYELATAEINRAPLVEIECFILMPDHYHLVLKQLQENGISKFMHRLSMGYANYLNLKYQRTGHVFETKFKARPVDEQEHFDHLPRYIHLNALDHKLPGWRNGSISDWALAKAILDSYPWSSHHVYSGYGQSFEVINESFARARYPSPKDYFTDLQNWSGRSTLSKLDSYF